MYFIHEYIKAKHCPCLSNLIKSLISVNDIRLSDCRVMFREASWLLLLHEADAFWSELVEGFGGCLQLINQIFLHNTTKDTVDVQSHGKMHKGSRSNWESWASVAPKCYRNAWILPKNDTPKAYHVIVLEKCVFFRKLVKTIAVSLPK